MNNENNEIYEEQPLLTGNVNETTSRDDGSALLIDQQKMKTYSLNTGAALA